MFKFTVVDDNKYLKRIGDKCKMKKKIIIRLAVIGLVIIFMSGAGIFIHNYYNDYIIRKEYTNVYKTKLEELCEEYSLSDSTIQVNMLVKDDLYYRLATGVTSDGFAELSAEEAYEFAKKYYNLEEEIQIMEDYYIYVDKNIICGEYEFSYNEGYDKGYDYLFYEMWGFEHCAIAFKDGEMVYNIFENKDYATLDRQTIENREDYANTGFASSYTNSSDFEMTEVMDAELKSSIWWCAKDIVENNLKSPSSAKFCGVNEASVYSNGGDEYTVIGYVDADNSYGANIRSSFITTLTFTGEGYSNGTVYFDE